MMLVKNGEAAGGPDIRAMSAATYAATAENFDAPALSFWNRFGRETVARIGLRTGLREIAGTTAVELGLTWLLPADGTS
jgi:hypothetical protein